MYHLAIFLTYLSTAGCASYQRYGDSTPYPNYSTYRPYSTVANLYNQFPYKGSYGNDLASFPEATRYSNYNPGLVTSRPYGVVNQYPGSNSYNQDYYHSTPQYGEVYRTGYSPYEMPFMKNRGYCVDRSPQTGIFVDSLTGMWYGVEFIQHLAGYSKVEFARTCIVIHISEPRDQILTIATNTASRHCEHRLQSARHGGLKLLMK